jgi:asparagine synthase (glutamine-hydrolysing)
MPGISVVKSDSIRNISGTDEVYETMISYALDSVLHDDRYTKQILLRAETFLVACTKYPEYPTIIYQNEDFWVCIEGKIYGKNDTQVKREVNELLKEIVVTGKYNKNKHDSLVNWLLTTDGEFIIYAMIKKSKDFIIINDSLGRLPLYYYVGDSTFVLSRELRIIKYLIWDCGTDMNANNSHIFDRMAIAQFLIFGFALERRTLLNGIYRFQPGTLFLVHDIPNKVDIQIENLFTFNFEQKKYAHETIKENTCRLISLFSEACKNRADPNGNNIISLSGGFDSRTVAECFHKNRIPCRAITYREPGWKPLLGNRSEAEIARDISGALGIKWRDYGTFPTRAKDILTLLKFKLGSVHLGYSFMFPILERLTEEYTSNAVFFTGYGGDKILVDLLPLRSNNNLEELAYNLILREGFLSLSDVSMLVQISEQEIIDELKRILSSYPEKKLDQKYVHFVLYGGSLKAIFEAEDIDRLHFWSTTPFFSVPFYDYSMNCSDKNKAYRKLYNGLMLAFSPSAAMIDNSDYGCSILSYKFRVIVPFLKTLTFRHPILKHIAAQIVKHKNGQVLDGKMLECIKNQMKNCEHILKYLSPAKLDKMSSDPAQYGLHTVYHLFTIFSLIEKVYSSRSSIDMCYD